MRTTALLLLAGFLSTSIAPQEPKKPPEKKEKSGNAITRFYQGETERLEEEVLGAWMLMDYRDPKNLSMAGGSGFAFFHDGLLSLTLAIDTVHERLFRTEDTIVLHSGLYRYRFDEQASLQLASIVVFSNENDLGDVQREPDTIVFEYYTEVADGVLEIRSDEGVVYTFRRLGAGDFPETAILKLEKRRGGANAWEDEEDR